MAIRDRADAARVLLDEASGIARAISGSPWQQADALTMIARHWVTIGDRERALALLSEATAAREDEGSASPQDAGDASKVLIEVAEALAELGRYEEAQAVARSIRNPGWRARALERVGGVADP